MKKILALLLVFVMVLSLAACNKAEEPKDTSGNDTTDPINSGNTTDPVEDVDYNTLLAGDYGTITLWVSESDGVKEQFIEQIEAFKAEYPNIIFTYEINTISEADAASQVLNDVASAPDIYCFAQDQLTRLVQASALAPVAESFAAVLAAANVSSSVGAASVAGQMYAFPMTADNGFYLYYDTSIFSESDVEDLATMVAVAEEKGVKIKFALDNAWYNAGFFFGAGCVSSWSMNEDGKWTGYTDTYNSDEGLLAMKAMQILAQSSCYDNDNNSFTGAGAVVTGTWASNDAAAAFGDNLGATDLPSVTVDGTTFHIGSYLGCKLMGVKPQSGDDAAYRVVVLQLLATYLTNEENQMARFNSFGWGPSNLNAQANEAVIADASLAALNKQNEYAIAQGNINGSWWDAGALLGTEAKNATSEADLKKALQDYADTLETIINKSDEELAAWSVVGKIGGDDSYWNIDLAMTKQDDGSYLSDVLALKAGDEFKVRQGGSWDVNYGLNGEMNGGNIPVEADGNYRVRLVIDGDNVTITLEAE